MTQIRREVLNAFKRLHRARLNVFNGDERALVESRKQINEIFRKNRAVNDAEEIKKMVQLALDVEKELRTNVMQAVQKDDHTFELRITGDTTRLDNYVFNPDAVIEPPRRRNKNQTPRCGGPVPGELNKLK